MRPPPAPAASPPTKPGPAAIATQGLTKRFGKTVAVDALTIRVPQGGITGFIGPNGAGKTTTIRMLLGLARPTAGDATVLGQPIARPLQFLPRVGALIEAPAFHAPLSGRRNLQALALLGGHDLATIPALLAQVGLEGRGNDPYGSYSLGMKQRLGIAAALLPDPDLLILDEPTNGLDPAGILEIRQLLQRLSRAGKTIFISSHLLAEVQRICDNVVIIRRGRLVFEGTVSALLSRSVGIRAIPQDPRHTARLLKVFAQAGFHAEERDGAVLVHAPPSSAASLNQHAARAGIWLRELHAHEGDLEETVLGLTGKGGL